MDEYPYSHYPTYCQGLFYLMDIHVISKLISLFEIEYGRNYVWIEDVFITGTLDVDIYHSSNFVNFDIPEGLITVLECS